MQFGVSCWRGDWAPTAGARRRYGLLAEWDGGVTAGPLLLPGLPGILLVSCCEEVELFGCELTRSCPDLAAGPFLLPGWPAIPAPEFCALGAVAAGLPAVCAPAGTASKTITVVAFSRFIVTSRVFPRVNQGWFTSGGNVSEGFELRHVSS
jgi:hypothetical protein